MPTFADRCHNGCYTALYEQICTSPPNTTPAIGAVSFHEDFESRTVYPDGSAFGKLNFHEKGDQAGAETTLAFFGEIAPSSCKTKMGALGNAREGVPVKDPSKVRDNVVLRAPSDTTPGVAEAFRNQIAVLCEAIEAGRGVFPPEYQREEIISVLDCKPGEDTLGLIKFSSDLKYKIPPGTKTTKPASAPKKRNLLLPPKSTSADDSEAESVAPSGDVPTHVGAFYEPSLCADYGGDVFQLERAKSVQLPYYDEDDVLIKPWEVRDKLRAGTLVIVYATFSAWLIAENYRNTPTLKKVYNLSIDSLKVFDRSPLEMEDIVIPTLSVEPAAGPSTPRKRPAEHFTSFSPSKSAPATPTSSPSKRTRRANAQVLTAV